RSSSWSFSSRARFVSLALRFTACSRLHLYALRHRHGATPPRRGSQLGLVRFCSHVCRRLLCCFYFFWRIGQRRRFLSSPEPLAARPCGRGSHPSLRTPPHRCADQIESASWHNPRHHPCRVRNRCLSAPRTFLCRPGRCPFFLTFACGLFWPFNGSLA